MRIPVNGLFLLLEVVALVAAYRLGKASAWVDHLIERSCHEPDEHDFTDVGRW